MAQLIGADTWRHWNELAIRHHYRPTAGFGNAGLVLGDIAKADAFLDAGPLIPTVITIPELFITAGTALTVAIRPGEVR